MKLLRLFLLLLPLSLTTACGFQPLYGNGQSKFGAVQIKPIDGRIGYFTEQKLKDKFLLSDTSAPSAILETKIVTDFQSTSLEAQSYYKRSVLNIQAEYVFSEIGAEPIKGIVSFQIGYDTSITAFADIALLSDAEERAGAEIANRIWFDILHKAQKK